MPTITIANLHAAIAAVAPIDGVSIGNINDRATWHIAFLTNATDAEKEAATALVAAYVEAPPPSSFLARDMIDLLTPADLVAIEMAVQGSAGFRLLWLRLRTREGRPVVAEGADFTQGWTGLMNALGKDRAAEIAQALGI